MTTSSRKRGAGKPPARKSTTAKPAKPRKATARKTPAKIKAKAPAKAQTPAKIPAKTPKTTKAKAKPAAKKAPSRAARARDPRAAAKTMLALVRTILDEQQAEEVAVIDLAGKTAIADFMVVASGRNPRHMGAMADRLREKIKAAGGGTPPIEGLGNAEWVLVDGGDVIVHLFRPEVRALYNLEKMWGGAWREEGEGGAGRA